MPPVQLHDASRNLGFCQAEGCRANARRHAAYAGAIMVASVDDSELAEALISVWRQVLVEGQNTVKLGGRNFPVGKTGRSRLRVVNFECESQKLVGIEQNPNTTSRWAAMARQGLRIMQFSLAGRYIANVADGRANFYRRRA